MSNAAPPVFFFTFADPDQESTVALPSLQQEEASIRAALASGEQTGSWEFLSGFHACRVAKKGKAVFLAGDFNDWTPDALRMQHEDDVWVFRIHLSVGKHVYKFIVDGKWIIDPGNSQWEDNEFDTGNSVLWMEEN